ncbi:hypothetical protein CLAFUW4_09526 [Fulvia fulva]|uniref:Uncharacterized protein n=1 Tax=Passalora fulva TaxID=5499 RepID=A0A9Q8UU09_PASFU|nr:uncharacterized protein CLAFUR5_09623 [Fulvia fulva]KAK4614221.1 hypothetical protein CLAFUR4_09532 [Fulvia fulva]KAK4614662.1 hypothetical protein CLAFUR0_09523 [Fulvia fulva]UJO22405.1 hypothetical protein CLAFUR5_09623 [Fulvia fulva]WPV20775.1 hypothetical protein CLAFUW4_09526 [Fulvia fulva]WPV35403.1 hypothetical protein CLAFUW7_09527 [Fulvia fulva]
MTSNIITIDTALSATSYHAAAAAASSASELVHISGQPGTNINGEVPDDYISQIELALLNLRKVILISGCKVEVILSLRFYIVGFWSR